MVSRPNIEAGRATIRFFADDSPLRRALGNIQARIRRFTTSLRRAGSVVAAAGAAITAPFVAASAIFSRVGDRADKLSQRLGISAEKLSELEFAANRSGSDLDTLSRGLGALANVLRNAERGLARAGENLGALGLTIEDLQGRSLDEQFEIVAQALSEIGDDSRRLGLAIQIFGRAGSQLLPLINGGRETIRDLGRQAREAGTVITTEDARRAARFTDDLGTLREQITATAVAVGSALQPALSAVLTGVRPVIAGVVRFVRNNEDLVRSVAVGGAALLAAGTAAVALAAGLVVLTSPLGLIVAGAATAAAAIAGLSSVSERARSFISDRFGSIASGVGLLISSAVNLLQQGRIEAAVELLMTTVELAVRKPLDDIDKRVTEVATAIESLLTLASNNRFAQAAAAQVAGLGSELASIFGLDAVSAGLRASAIGNQFLADNPDARRSATFRALAEIGAKAAERENELTERRLRLQERLNSLVRQGQQASSDTNPFPQGSGLNLPDFEDIQARGRLAAQSVFFSARAAQIASGGDERELKKIRDNTKSAADSLDELVRNGVLRWL
ncbi:MAG: phage tail tape measure protein [Planctomycetota bacterium]